MRATVSRILACLATVALPSLGFAGSIQNVPRYQELVLSDRLVQIYNRQKDLAKNCESSQPGIAAEMNTKFPKYRMVLRGKSAEAGFESLKNTNLQFIELVKEQRSLLHSCLKDPSSKLTPMSVSPRKNLATAPLDAFLGTACADVSSPIICAKDVALFTKKLRPFCFKAERAIEGVYEDYACLAGDGMLDASLRPRYKDDRYLMLNAFAVKFLQATMSAEKKASIDLYQIHKSVSTEVGAEVFLASMTAVGGSGNSGLVGYLQGLEDRWLIEDLASNLSAPVIHDHYALFQQAKLLYLIARDQVAEKGIHLSVGLTDVTDWNRHNFMAAYLACDFSREAPAEIVRTYVSMIGVGYEGRDFFSHLSRGVSLKASRKNFDEDTERYRESARLGIAWCHRK